MATVSNPLALVAGRLDNDASTCIAFACGIAQTQDPSHKLRLEHLVYAVSRYGGAAAVEWFEKRGLDRGALDTAIQRAAARYGRSVAVVSWARIEPMLEWATGSIETSSHAASALASLDEPRAPSDPSSAAAAAIQNAAQVTSLDIITPVSMLEAAFRVTECHVIEELTQLMRIGRSTVRLAMLNDDAIVRDADDRLGLSTYADAIAGLIDDPDTGTPLTLAISAPWGAGKTTLARMVQARLEEKSAAGGYYPHVTCWFNAWMHDGAKDLASAFAAAVAREADTHRSFWRRVLNPLPTSMLPPTRRTMRRVVIAVVTIGIASIVTWLFAPTLVEWLFTGEQKTLLQNALDASNGLPVAGAIVLLLAVLRYINTAATAVAGFVRSPESPAASGGMDEVRDQLSRLIRQATPRGSRFVLFIDDLERCRPPRPIEVLEVVNQLLSSGNIVTVLMADMPAVAACADIKYKEFATANYSPDADQQARARTRMTLSYGWLYLQKIVQLRFDVPTYRTKQLTHLIDSLVEGRPQTAEPEPAKSGSTSERISPMLAYASRLGAALDAPTLRGGASVAALAPTAASRILSMIGLGVSTPGLMARNLAERLTYPPQKRPPVLAPLDTQAIRRGRKTGPILAGVALVAFVALSINAMRLALANNVPLARLFAGNPIPGAVVTAVTAVRISGMIFLTLFAVCFIAGIAIAAYQRRADRRRVDWQRTRRPAVGEKDAIPAFARELAYSERVKEASLLIPARDEALKHIPQLPRSSKRLLNELRLYLYILSSKNLFDDGQLSPQHVGKWLAMRERWPELARLVAVRPALVANMELDMNVLKNISETLADDIELTTFVRDFPQLGAVVERLARFEAQE